MALTIEPGVVVKVNPGLGLQIDGTLIARGTPTAPITFGALRVRIEGNIMEMAPGVRL